MKCRNLWVVVLLVMAVSCQTAKVNSDNATIDEKETPTKNQLLFLTLKVEKATSGLQFSILDTKLTDGKLKRQTTSPNPNADRLMVLFLSEQEDVIQQIEVENPLTRWVEVSDEKGGFERHQLDLDHATIVLRLQYLNRMSKVRITDLEGEVLSTIDLDL